jgi:hypothetical protein
LGKAAKEVPALANAVPVAQVQATAQALVALADGIVQGKPLPADNSEVVRLAHDTIEATQALLKQGLPQLDQMLAERESGLLQARWAVDGMTLLCVLMAGYLLYCFYRVTRRHGGGAPPPGGHDRW